MPAMNAPPPLSNFPKLHCPLVRQTFAVRREGWKRGRRLGLRRPEVYLVVDRVNPGYEWVFEDPDTFAVEKLDGTNVKILMEDGRLVAMQNRKNVIDPVKLCGGKPYLMQAVVNAAIRGGVQPDGEQAGEVIGPKVQGNPYQLDTHEWYGFDRSVKSLSYRSFHEHDRTFDNWSLWFEKYLFSRFFTKRASKLGIKEKVFAEGVVFYNLRRRDEGLTWRAKLRRGMFAWYYEGTVEVLGYDPAQ